MPCGVTPGETAAGIGEDFCARLARDIAQLKTIQAWLAGGSKTDIEAAAKLGAAFEGDITASFAALDSFFLTTKGEPRARLATKALADAQPGLLAALQTLQLQFCQVAERRRAARAAQLAHAALTVIQSMSQRYRDAKRLRGVLDYDDLIVETRNLLSRRGAAQWVLYKLDGGIDHVLIDEAQDTSP